MAKANEKQGFERIHYFLVDALQKLDRHTWPARIHCGGPLPVLTYNAQPRIAALIVAHARPFADDVAAFDRLAEIVETRAAKLTREAADKATKARSKTPALEVARLAARAIYNYRFAASSAMNTMGRCITNAVTTYVEGFADHAPFLAAVDAAIVREELCDRLVERAIAPSSPIARVLSRPATGKSFGLALATLVDDNYGLFVKLKNTWQWHEGDRATVFATVPDAFMAQVADDLG